MADWLRLSHKCELNIRRQVSDNCEWPAAMAGLQEIHSFMGKFVSLWKNVYEAILRIQSKAGKASISMEVELWQAFPPRKPGPSRLRRSERRAEANAQENTSEEAVAEEATAGQEKAIQASAAEALHENAKTEDAKADETNVEKTVAVEEPTTKDAGKAPASGLEVNDEFCSNQKYSQAKSNTIP